MTENTQNTISLNKFEIRPVIKHLQRNYGFAHAGIFDTKSGGQIKFQSYGDKNEIVYDNCTKKEIGKLVKVIEQNE
jgi:hypothetical protein